MSTAGAEFTWSRIAATDLVRVLLAVGLIAVGGAIGLASLWVMLHGSWSNVYGAFSHGYLAVVLTVALGVRAWKQRRPAPLHPYWPAVAVLLALILMELGMELMFLNSSRSIVLPPIILASVATVFGLQAARTLFWPIMFLYVALPQWWALNSSLQSLTSAVVGALVTVTNLPAYVEGNFVRVPAGMFEIASGCSGLNYVVAAISLAGYYALMYLQRWRSRIVLLGAAAAAAIVSNFVRVYLLIVIGIATDMQHYLIRVEHLYFGWALFMISMIPIWLLARKLDDVDASAVAATSADRSERPASSGRSPSPSIVPAALLAGAILALPALVTFGAHGQDIRALELPRQLGSWARVDADEHRWSPTFVNAEEELTHFVHASQQVDFYRAFYPHQSSDARLIRTDNDFFGRGWRLAEQQTLDAATHRVVESRGYLSEQERLIWSWYIVAGKPAATKLSAKLRELSGLLAHRRDAAGVAISTECVPDCAAARARLANFMQEYAASPPRQ